MMLDQLPLGIGIVVFCAFAAVVWFAGSRLAGYVDQIAELTNLGRAMLGLIVFGGITSLPELAVATTATLAGAPLLSVNDVLGSAAINIIILAIADVAIGRDALTSLLPSPAVVWWGCSNAETGRYFAWD